MSLSGSSGLQLLPLNIQDLPAIQKMKPEGWADIIPAFRFYLQNEFCYPMKAMLGNEMIGCGVALLHRNVCWLAGIIVLPEHRKKGYGTEITGRLMELVQLRTRSFLLIATPLGRPVYERLGFRHNGRYLLFAPGRINSPVSENIIPFSENYRQALYELDQRLSGELRQHLLALYVHEAFLYVENGFLQGFFMPTLGEGLIYAENPVAGLALLQLRLLEERHTIIPEENKAAISFLEQNGFTQDNSKTFYRMSYGEELSWKPECLYSRIGGNLG